MSKPKKPSTKPAAVKQLSSLEEAELVVGQLDDARSMLAVAAKALDNVDERNERRVNDPVKVVPDDVATALRIVLAMLEEARDTLQDNVIEGRPTP